MAYRLQALLIALEPAQRADGAGRENDPVAVAPRFLRQPRGEPRCDGHAARIVVGKRRVTDVREEKHFFARASRQEELAVAERAALERALDPDVVLAVAQRIEIAPAQTETPVALVVASPVGNPVRIRLVHVQVRLELLQSELALERLGVTDEVQIVLLKIHDPAALCIE